MTDTHAPEVDDASFKLPPHHILDEALNFIVPAAKPSSLTEFGGPIAEVPL